MSSLEPRIVPDDQDHDQHHDPGDTGPEPSPPLEVEVRRNAAVAALVGAASSAMAIAYITRAVSTGGVLDWVFGRGRIRIADGRRGAERVREAR